MPEHYEVMLFLAQVAMPTLFVFMIGACWGSLANVLVYRLPRGLNPITPPSACPHCGTRLTWRENIPILGWVLLRGRCRFCKSKISPEYPIVELFTATLFAGLYVLWYCLSKNTTLFGLKIGLLQPSWAAALGIQYSWPLFVMILVLLLCLIVMTLVDAKTCTIPLSLTWLCAGMGFVVHPLATVVAGLKTGTGVPPPMPDGWLWAIPTPAWTHIDVVHEGFRLDLGTMGWWWIGASIGGMLGIGVAMLLLKTGLIRRSFSDYEAWEAEQLRQQAGSAAPSPDTSASVPAPAPAHPHNTDDPTQLWIAYPHARREMVKELAFLAPIILLAIAGGYLADALTRPDLSAVVDHAKKFGSPEVMSQLGTSYPAAPFWLYALCGSFMGYLLGAGLVWAVRVFGSLAFGKEAMGLGDVHLMGGVGAVLGWIDAGLAFFAAAFVGMAWTILTVVFGRGMRRTMPYGPYLAVATVLVLVFKPLFEALLSAVNHGEPITLPG